MKLEIKLKYYNSTLGVGFNNIIDGVYCANTNQWLAAKCHLGRLVFGTKRIPYKKIKEGIDKKDYLIQKSTPF
mgnify:CR=1 FL=1